MEWLSGSSILIIFFTCYAGLHSLLASFPAKRWARRVFGPGVDRWYRPVYNLIAIITLLPLPLLLWLWPGQPLYVVPAPWRWLMMTGQVMALAGFGIALLQTAPFKFLGLTQLLPKRNQVSPSHLAGNLVSSLQVNGIYSRVRHPLYLFSIIFIWLTPTMTVNLFILYLMLTVYFYIGSLHEEKRLLTEFGQAYRDYQNHVPRFIPRPGRRYKT